MDEEKKCDKVLNEENLDEEVKTSEEGTKDSAPEGESDKEGVTDKDKAESDEESLEEVKKAADERYARLMAEFQNYKKRTAKEKQDIHAYANEKLVKELLEVVDNFERALTLMDKGDDNAKSEDDDAMLEGVQLIFTQLKDVLTKAGLKEIEALGSDFNPEFHHAVINEQTEEYESGKVSKVLQKGYTLNDRVVRPAMVAVAE